MLWLLLPIARACVPHQPIVHGSPRSALPRDRPRRGLTASALATLRRPTPATHAITNPPQLLPVFSAGGLRVTTDELAIRTVDHTSMDDSALQAMRILVVDEHPERILAIAGYSNTRSTRDPSPLEPAGRDQPPHLIPLDLHMPEVSGFQVMAWPANAELPYTGPPAPVLVLTADGTREARRRALFCGAIDFVTKPFDGGELELRVSPHLHARRITLELDLRAGDQEQRARAEHVLDSTRPEVLQRPADAAEFRDNALTLHTWRVVRLSGTIAADLGVAPHECERLTFAARPQDMGRIAIPDEFLFERAPLSPSECDAVQHHTIVGGTDRGRQLPLTGAGCRDDRSLSSRTLGRWRLPGRPARSCDPISGTDRRGGRVCDVLTHECAYASAWTHERARAHISVERERQFDPQPVGTFPSLDPGTFAGKAGEASLGAQA